MLAPRSWLSTTQSYENQNPEQNNTLDVHDIKIPPLHSDYEDNIEDNIFIPTSLKEKKKMKNEKNMNRKKVSPQFRPQKKNKNKKCPQKHCSARTVDRNSIRKKSVRD